MGAKKKTKTQQELIQENRQFIQKQKAQAQQYKNKILPFVRFLKKNKLSFHHARVGNSRIEYFRLDQFEKLLAQKQSAIASDQKLNDISKTIRQQLIYFKRPSHLKSKYPNMLQPVVSDSSDRKFCSFRFDTTQSKKWMMIGLILGVLSLVLFPIWPYELKYAIWLLSLILLIVLVGLIVLRLVIYLICVIFGYNVWLLPNLLGQYGFVDSFKPILYYEKWDISLFNILLRILVFSSLAAYGSYLYLNPDVFYDNINMTKSTVEDIHDWGVGKIKNQKNFSQRAITNLDQILNQTADLDREQIKENKDLEHGTTSDQKIPEQQML